MHVNLKFVEEQRKVLRTFGASAMNPAAIEALLAVSELYLSPTPTAEVVVGVIGEPESEPEPAPVRKPRIKSV